MKLLLTAALLTLGLTFGLRAADKEKPDAKAPTAAADGHNAVKVGPTNGRLLTAMKPVVEFFVNKDKKIEIRFVDDSNKVLAPGTQEVSVTLGERAKPTKLTFTKDGDHLISDKVIPEGNDYPTVVQVKADAKAKAVNAKFNLNMNKCPDCANQEYNCTCAHAAEETPKKVK